MFTVGVTGGIGSGKSIVCDVFFHLGIPVYQADTEAKRLMVKNPVIRTGLLKYFGEAAFNEGQLNRKFLAERIFYDTDARNYVNSLVHPAVRDDFAHWAGNQAGAPYVLEEAALLLESGAWKEMDYIVLVDVGEETRIARIIKRDGISRADALARMASQMEPGKRREYADFIIRNDEHELVIPQVLKLDKIVRELARKKHE